MAEQGSAERIKAHWDSMAASYQEEFTEKATLRLIEQIRSKRDWLGINFLDEDEKIADAADQRVVRLLDYACGPGMVSRAFGPYVTQTLGIDLSDGMVKAYNDGASNHGLSPNQMFSAAGNLLDPNNPSPAEFRDEKWFNFDLAVVGLGFHHFEDPALAASRLAERLRPGGVLSIIDFLPHEGHVENVVFGGDHAVGHEPPVNQDVKRVMEIKPHTGFQEEQIKKAFEKAGLGKEFGFEVIAKGAVFSFRGRTGIVDVFMAKGMKA